MYWILLIVLIIILVTWNYSNNRDKAKEADKQRLIASGVNPDEFIRIGNYLGGLTYFTKQYHNVKLNPTKEGFDIYVSKEPTPATPDAKYETVKVGTIQNKDINNVVAEDKSTSEKRMSVGNIALFGPIGLAMRKTKNTDLSFLIFSIQEGRFKSEAIFAFEKQNAARTGSCFAEAQEARAKIIKHLKSIENV